MLVAIVNFLRAWRRYNASLKKSSTSSATANWPISASPDRTSRGSRGTALTAEILKPSMKAPAPRALSPLRPWNLSAQLRPDLFRPDLQPQKRDEIISSHERRAPASSARHRRRACRIRGGLADLRARRPSRAARDASAAHDRGPQDRGACRAGVLEFLPFRRQRAQRRRAFA